MYEQPVTPSAQIAIGSNVQSKCGACKQVTVHAVITMEEKVPLKVRCSICERAHKFRSPPKPRTTKSPKKISEMDEWKKFSSKWDKTAALAYSPDREFNLNDLVNHSKFGLGKVRKKIEPNKIKVLFEGGIKLMACTH